MKARFGTRLILIVVAIILLLFSIVTLYVGIRSNGIALDKETVDVLKELREAEKPEIGAAGYWTIRRIVVIGMGALELISSLLLFSIPGRIRYKRKDFVVQQNDSGEIRIAVKAIENLVRKCTDTHEEFNMTSLRVKNYKDGVVVDLKGTVPDNISIPLATESMQKQIRQYLTVSSGVNVKTVNVDLSDTDAPMEKKSPYDVGNEIADKQEEQKAAHELIFEEETPAPAEETPAPAPEAPAPAEEAAAVQEAVQETVQEAAQETAVQAEQEVEAMAEEAAEAVQETEDEIKKQFGGEE